MIGAVIQAESAIIDNAQTVLRSLVYFISLAFSLLELLNKRLPDTIRGGRLQVLVVAVLLSYLRFAVPSPAEFFEDQHF